MIGRSLRRFTAAIILIALSAGPIAGNEIVQYEYDALARISTACYVLQDKLVTYTYDAAGNRTAVTTTNGVCGATTFAIENPTPVLAGTALNFSVRRHGSTSATNAVNYATANGTAVAGTHYTAKSGNLSFSIGQTVRNVTVNTTSGSIPSGSRSMVVNLSSATGGATITTSQAAGVINANTAFKIENAAPVTQGSTLSFTVRRIGATGGTNAVSYATANGTAIAGTHYTAKSGTLSFTSGQTVKTVTVNTTSGSFPSGSRTMYVNLSNPTNGAGIDVAQGSGVMTVPPNNPPVAVNDTHSGYYYVFTNVPV